MVNIAFRINSISSSNLRSILIASAIKESNQDAQVFFLTSSTNEAKKILSDYRFDFSPFPPITSVYEDIEATIESIDTLKIDILVVDNPQANEKYLQSIKEKVKFLALIDDHCKLAKYPCDLVINPNVFAHTFDYPVSADFPLFLGSEFFSLSNIFDDFSDYKRENPDSAKRLMVYLGSKDRNGITLNIVSALASIKENFTATLVLDKDFSRGSDLAAIIGLDDRFVIINDSNEVKKKMAMCDLAIIGSCDIFYEFAFFKVPCINVLLSENDLVLSNYLSQNSFTIQSSTSIEDLKRTISSLINDKLSRDRLSLRLEELIDGLGRFRVAQEIIRVYTEKIK